MEANQDILLFYGWWQLSVCGFAFFAFLAIWWHIGRLRKDHGQVWLALSILCWSLSGASEIWYATNSEADEFIISGLRSVFSLFNSLFILLALPWFKYLPQRIKPLIMSPYWYAITGLPFLFSIVPTVRKFWTGESSTLMSELDVYFAFLTLLFLGSVLWTSFKRRRLEYLAWLSLVSIGITLVAQIYKLTGSSINLTLYSAIFKTTLIMIFFALALSWVKELSEHVIPGPGYLSLSLYVDHQGSEKVHHKAIISGIPGLIAQPIGLTPANYELFLKFAFKKKNQNEWLEIKPKDGLQKGKVYDIKDHNEIKRLLQNLLNGLFGKDSWTKEHHYIPLKQSLFESSKNKERRIRLRLPVEQIDVQNPRNQDSPP